MESEHEASASDCIDQLIKVVLRVREEGGLFGGKESDIASIAYRRWRSFDRRHQKLKNPKYEDRLRDLAKGIKPDYDPNWLCTHPEEIKHLAAQLAAVLNTSDM